MIYVCEIVFIVRYKKLEKITTTKVQSKRFTNLTKQLTSKLLLRRTETNRFVANSVTSTTSFVLCVMALYWSVLV